MIKSITNFFFIFQQLKSQISQIDLEVNLFCDETLQISRRYQARRHGPGGNNNCSPPPPPLWLFGVFCVLVSAHQRSVIYVHHDDTLYPIIKIFEKKIEVGKKNVFGAPPPPPPPLCSATFLGLALRHFALPKDHCAAPAWTLLMTVPWNRRVKTKSPYMHWITAFMMMPPVRKTPSLVEGGGRGYIHPPAHISLMILNCVICVCKWLCAPPPSPPTYSSCCMRL